MVAARTDLDVAPLARHGRADRRHDAAASAMACVCAALVACGDDSGGGGPPPEVFVDTGIDSSSHVSELSPAEEQRLCDEVAEATLMVLQAPGIVTGFCTLEGILLSLLSPAADRERVCEEFVANCTAPLSLPDLSVFGANCGKPDPTCDATVGEIEQCTNAAIAALESFYLDVSCRDLSTITIAPAVPVAPTDCQDVERRCPDLYRSPTSASTSTAR